jgi:hypothetical protein
VFVEGVVRVVKTAFVVLPIVLVVVVVLDLSFWPVHDQSPTTITITSTTTIEHPKSRHIVSWHETV